MPDAEQHVGKTAVRLYRRFPAVPQTSRSASVAQNTAIVVGGEFLSRVISFLSFLLVARCLGVKLFGEYAFIFSFLSFFDLLASLGMNSILVRELSSNPERASSILKVAWVVRCACTVLAIFSACLVASFLHLSLALKMLICIASLGLLINFRPVFEAVYRVRLKMGVPTAIQLFRAFLFLGLVGICVFFKTGLEWFVLVSIFSNLAGTAAIAGMAVRELKPSGTFDWKICRNLLRESLPMVFSGILTVLYIRVDVMMLTFMKGFQDVGFYSAATRLTEALLIIPVALMATLFPVLSEHAKHNRARFQEVVTQGIIYLTVFVLPIAILTMVYAESILGLLFQSKYGLSAPALTIVVWAFVFSYPNIIMVNAVIALRRQIVDTWISLFAVIANICINLWCIPAYGFIGASWTTVLCEVLVFVLLSAYMSVYQSLSLPWWKYVRLALIGLIGFFAMSHTASSVPRLVAIPLFLILYVVALFVFGVLRRKDGRFFLDMIAGLMGLGAVLKMKTAGVVR